MDIFHLVTDPNIVCMPGMQTCGKQAVVCEHIGTSFGYFCTEHTIAGIGNRDACLNLATAVLNGAGIRFAVVRNDPYDMKQGRQTIPGFSYWAEFYSPASMVPVLRVELWGPRDGAPPDLLNALAAFCYNPFSTEEEAEIREELPLADFERWQAEHLACEQFVELWQKLLEAVQSRTGTAFDLTYFLMTTVRQWA